MADSKSLKELIELHVQDKALKEQLLNSPDLHALFQASDAQLSMLLNRFDRLKESFEMRTRAYEQAQKLMSIQNQDIRYRAYHDSLTGLANRPALMERLENTLVQAQRNNLPFALLFIDLDNFKPINDSYGHDVGDALLIEVAKRFKSVTRESDMVARLAGDEFCVLLSNIDSPAHSARVVRTIFRQFKHPVTLGEHEVTVQMSVGICHYPEDGKNADELMRNADIAMYEAKHQDENSLQFYERRLTEQVSQRIEFEQDLYRAIDNNELSVKLEPQLETRTGKLLGAQARLIWNHPQRGQMSAQQFYAIISDQRLLLPILNWQLEQACTAMLSWKTVIDQELTMSVPIDARQFLHKEFMDIIKELRNEHPTLVKSLELMVDEDVVSQDRDVALKRFKQLNQLGFKTGLSNCGRGLLPAGFFKAGKISTLQIDRHLLPKMSINAESRGLVKGLLVIADSLNINSRATGIATYQQLEQLERLDCQQVSGSYFSEPLNGEDFLTVLARFKPQALEEQLKDFLMKH